MTEMNDIRAEYERKKQSVEQILEKIRSGDKIFVGFYGGEPRTILRRIHEIARMISGSEITQEAIDFATKRLQNL